MPSSKSTARRRLCSYTNQPKLGSRALESFRFFLSFSFLIAAHIPSPDANALAAKCTATGGVKASIHSIITIIRNLSLAII